MSSIRPYHPADRDDVYAVCVRTGASGGDATGLYSSDDLLPDIFAGPYVAYQPDLAFVVDTGDHVAGYVIGVADSLAFADWYEAEWLPGFVAKHPLEAARDERDRRVIGFGLDVRGAIVPEVDRYPAHLHIDLLPELQGQGFGRSLIRTLLNALRERGVPGVYLTMSATNHGARAFYERLGFAELPSSTPEAPALAISTDAQV
ncbi:GNAT family N-acetyltransferase [Leifsonia sp. ZF2019]|uniref:GNAT family N-acetyltransferase n=1 Tax=Leifsonia sp. ZF2019 TaxID=2781978 RepID=UPI001CBE3350|nr:GNAT family N-acetyltransferase [Leifsonia sp. ZF2019]UAJ80407.1 GNAT family N-acetyltransferase [Leifsonia sp. ZF2019]